MASMTQTCVPVNAAKLAKAGDARALLAIPEARQDLPRLLEGGRADRYTRTATEFGNRKAINAAKPIVQARLDRREARKVAEAARKGPKPGRFAELVQVHKHAIQEFSGRRLRVRQVNEDGSLFEAARQAVQTGKVARYATDGGHVANAYGYRAETEWVECHAVVTRGVIRGTREVGRSDASKNAASINSPRGFGTVREAREVAECGARVGVVSPTGRTFTFFGARHWARGRFGWGTAKRPEPVAMTPAQARRALSRAIERNNLPYTVTLDGKTPVIIETATGEQFHISGCHPGIVARSIREARTAFAKRSVERRQKTRNEQLDAYLVANASRIYVTVEDSLSTGNCSSQTSVFRDRLAGHVGATGEIGAVSAEVILMLRDDNYTRRACRAATLRYAK